MAQIESLVRDTPGVKHTVGISGQSLILGANAPNLGSMYVMLDDFAERRDAAQTADAIAAAIRDRCQQEVQGAIVSAFGAPPIDGLGTTGGFKLDHRGPRQSRPGGVATGQRRDRRRRQPDAGAARPVQQSPAPTRPGCTSTSTAPSAWPWACRSATSSTRCKSISARST